MTIAGAIELVQSVRKYWHTMGVYPDKSNQTSNFQTNCKTLFIAVSIMVLVISMATFFFYWNQHRFASMDFNWMHLPPNSIFWLISRSRYDKYQTLWNSAQCVRISLKRVSTVSCIVYVCLFKRMFITLVLSYKPSTNAEQCLVDLVCSDGSFH